MGSYTVPDADDRDDIKAINGIRGRASTSRTESRQQQETHHPANSTQPWGISQLSSFMTSKSLGSNGLHGNKSASRNPAGGPGHSLPQRPPPKRQSDSQVPSTSDSGRPWKRPRIEGRKSHTDPNRPNMASVGAIGGTSDSPYLVDYESELEDPKSSDSSTDELDVIERAPKPRSSLTDDVKSRYFDSAVDNDRDAQPSSAHAQSSSTRVNGRTSEHTAKHGTTGVVFNADVPWEAAMYNSSSNVGRKDLGRGRESPVTGKRNQRRPPEVEDEEDDIDEFPDSALDESKARQPSPSLDAIPPGNTSAKSGQLRLFRESETVKKFRQDAVAQQPPGSSTGGKLIERMRRRNDIQPRPVFDEHRQSQEFSRLDINGTRTEPSSSKQASTMNIVDMTVDDEVQEAEQRVVPAAPRATSTALSLDSSRDPPPLPEHEVAGFLEDLGSQIRRSSAKANGSSYRPPPDDGIMQPPPLKNTEAKPPKTGVMWNEIPIELIYIGRWKIPEHDAKRFKLTFNQYLFKIEDAVKNIFYFTSLFSECVRVRLTRPKDAERICMIELPGKTIDSCASKCPPKSMNADDQEFTMRSICIKFSNDAVHARPWDELCKRFTDKVEAGNREFVHHTALKTFVAEFEEKAMSESALRIAHRDSNGGAVQGGPRIVAMQNAPRSSHTFRSKPTEMSKASGTPIPTPKAPSYEREAPARPVFRTAVSQLATARETRSSAALAKASADRVAPVQTTLPTTESRKVATRGSNRRRSPSPDPNEVIIGGAGVHITRGDLKRLAPGEFLNDTLIEFGLQQWQKQFAEDHPDIARDIHVFNTFFFKKLNNRNHEAGYESVRKWTNKVDIFCKKYIIVPINEHLHWYLAIICNPQYILRTPPAPLPIEARKSKRLSATTDQDANKRAGSVSSLTDLSDAAADEAEVENLATFTNDGDAAPPAQLLAVSPSALNDAMDVDGVGSDEHRLRASVELGAPPSPSEHADSASVELGLPVSPVRVVDETDLTTVTEGDLDSKPDGSIDDASEEVTRIFTFDSLTGRHPSVIATLKRYLKAEAKDKKRLHNTSDAVGKAASVPTQNNYHDCGLYLIHFVEKFFEDPEDLVRKLSANFKRGEAPNWDEIWHQTGAKEKRDAMATQIQMLASSWKKQQEEQARQQQEDAQGKDAATISKGKSKDIPSEAEKGEASIGPPPPADEEDDDEVLIVGERNTKPPTPKGKGGKKKQQQALPKDKAKGRRNIIAADSQGPGSSQEVQIVEAPAVPMRPATRLR